MHAMGVDGRMKVSDIEDDVTDIWAKDAWVSWAAASNGSALLAGGMLGATPDSISESGSVIQVIGLLAGGPIEDSGQRDSIWRDRLMWASFNGPDVFGVEDGWVLNGFVEWAILSGEGSMFPCRQLPCIQLCWLQEEWLPPLDTVRLWQPIASRVQQG